MKKCCSVLPAPLLQGAPCMAYTLCSIERFHARTDCGVTLQIVWQ